VRPESQGGWLETLVWPARVPVVLTREEVRAILHGMPGTTWLVGAVLYGAWGKGDRDRVTMLLERLKSPLLHHLAEVRRQHERDLADGAGWVELPGALGIKYPAAGREWAWQWVFPATRPYTHLPTQQSNSVGAIICTSRSFADFGQVRTPVSVRFGRSFRCYSDTCFGAFRTPVSGSSDAVVGREGLRRQGVSAG